MKASEDVKMSLRSIRRRPLESLLLVIGIALSIGATAAGISMISTSIEEKNAILDSTTYKEIVVQARESADDMELPATRVSETDEDIILSLDDLYARNGVADIEYAYLAETTRFRFSNFAIGARPGETQSAEVQTAEAQTTEGQTADAQASEAQTTKAQTADAQSSAGPSQRAFEIPVVEGPQPVLEEVAGLEVSPEYFAAWNLVPAAGGIFTDQEMEDDAKVMVIGSSLGDTLFEDGVAIGREIAVFQSVYEIVGILEPTGTTIDETAIVPAQVIDVALIRGPGAKFGGGSTLHFTVYDATRLDEAMAQLTEWFGQEYGEGQVAISIPREEVEASQDRTFRLISVILFLAVAGLFIASVNVSNILLGRAMRRRRVVGILKALGATTRSVFSLFFFEAVVIGVLGTVLGTGVSMMISSLMTTSGSIVSGMLFIGVLGACAVSTTLTIFPALQASRIPAAEALRYE